MQVEIFTLCDAATNQAGKLNILGSFDTIWVKDVPTQYPQCSVAVKVRFEPIEVGKHTFAIDAVDFDGKKIIPSLKGEIDVKFAHGQKTRTVDLVLNVQGLKLEALGEYAINFAIDGRQLSSLPLYVKERSPKPIEA